MLREFNVLALKLGLQYAYLKLKRRGYILK